MTTDPPFTLTDVLTAHRTVRLLGRRIQDLSPRGDLGLGLDPQGPVGFALVRAFSQGAGWALLPEPLVLSVFGPGQAPAAADMPAAADERVWMVDSRDTTVRLALLPGTVGAVLQAAVGAARPGGAPPLR